MISKRMSKIESSGIRRVFDLAANMKNPVNLSIGQPDFDVPIPVKEAAIDAINQGFNNYTPTQGAPDLRQAISADLQAKNRLVGHEDYDVMVSSGTSGGLFLSMLAMIDPGDEVLFTDPYFVLYKHFINLMDGTPVYVDTYPDFELTAERLERCITPKSKILIINCPNNPTGQVYRQDNLKEIAELCNKHGIIVISDEIYSAFSYDQPSSSIMPLVERGVLLDGFSKSYAMTGWRVGYAAGCKELIQEMNTLQQYTYVCSPSMAQKGAVKALELSPDAAVAEYKVKRDLIYAGLKDKYEISKSSGAFYAFIKAPHGTGTEFVEEAIANNLLIIPGSVFSERDTHFRISFAVDNKVIQQGIDILNKLAD